MSGSDKNLLVYIPCHSDLDLAITQAQKIRTEFSTYANQKYRLISKIEIVISLNFYDPSQSQLELAASISDLTINRGKLFLADANIANGFMVAYQRKADFLWMLSANDELIDLGFLKIISSLSNDIDLLVTGIHKPEKLKLINNVIYPAMNGYSFGLISGVVYNCQTLANFFNVADFFIWTGWSQLSVIQNAINGKNGLKVRTLDTFEIYKQRQTQSNLLSSKYGHSFYGYIILGYVFSSTKNEKKRFVRAYVFTNTFNFLLYRRDSNKTSQVVDPNNYLVWNQDLAESIIKRTSILLYCYYSIVSRLPFWFFGRILEYSKERREKETH